MPKFVLNRNYLLRTTAGCVAFEKGVPTWVTPEMQRYAQEIGAERVDGPAEDFLEPEQEAKPEVGPIERQEELYAAFGMLIERNESGDFTGQGVPTVKAVEKIVSFDVDRAEVTSAWAEYKQAKAEAQ